MVTEDSVRDAYVFLRNNFTIPEEVLDFMYKAAIEGIQKEPKDVVYINTEIPESEVIKNLEEEVKRLRRFNDQLKGRIEEAANCLYDNEDCDSGYHALCALGFEC